MPILPLEPFVLPDDLFDNDVYQNDKESFWKVLHVRPRAEKKLAGELLAAKVPFFLPLYENRSENGNQNKNRIAHLPLFPSYLFLFGNETDRLKALKTNRVVQVLQVVDQKQLYSDLKRVHQLICTDEPLTPEESLAPGVNVKIVRGPFAGMDGKVLRRGKKLKLLVEVQMLRQGVSAEIETWMVEAVEDA